MEKIQQKKYEIKKTFNEALKIYFLIVRPAIIPPIMNERAIGVVAYKVEDAVEKAREDYATPGMTAISHNDYISVEDMLKKINVEGITIVSAPQSPRDVKPEKKPTIGLEGLKAGLLLAMEEYVKNKEDQEHLKRIVSNLKKIKL